ncbi:hypothetical protein Poly51_22490 [Rubripirellula tenax]|uniref:DUF1559 domain-containing protein n=1 Tax=Rubripirellula tenax TaxID=2528015 RepID=A0A5C6FIH5_9BACT|nr:DUF1559 domain-containing protein [Rubripirellula tenax]TWU59461.1 hypothetical protein Poly51_22490 [Rubripirellula tenax]
MPFLFTCPECQTKTQVDDRYSGLAGQCVTCGAKIQMPSFSTPSPAPSAPPSNSKTKSVGWIAAIVVAFLLIGSLLFAMIRFGGQTMSTLASNREQTASIRNLERIASAINAYAADQGTYPPAILRDSKQAALHSWRVLLLPYLGEDDLYNRFDLNLAWDHPINIEAAGYGAPSVYQHPSGNANGLYGQSSYYLITGPGTLFPSRGSLGPADVTDDLSQTILVTEAVVTSQMWTEPIDLDVTRMQGNISTNLGNEPGGLSTGGVTVVTTDGRGHFIADTIDPAVFRALVSPQGGERLADDVLD